MIIRSAMVAVLYIEVNYGLLVYQQDILRVAPCYVIIKIVTVKVSTSTTILKSGAREMQLNYVIKISCIRRYYLQCIG